MKTVVIALLTLMVGSTVVPRQETPHWRVHLLAMTGEDTVWWTSNEAYATAESGEVPSYGMGYVMGFGGTSASGCLWGNASSGRQKYWMFHMAWDPVQETLIAYQAGADGTVGIGYEAMTGGATTEMDQTFVLPDGSSFRVRHESVKAHADTLITRSFDWQDGKWAPRRTYTWVRRPGNPREICDDNE